MSLDTALAHPLEVKHLLLNNEVEYDTIPKSIATLKNLKSLSISNQKSLDFETLFKSLESLDSLEELSIKESNINLDGGIRNLKQLKVLELIRNDSKAFPLETIDSLNLDVLVIVEGNNGFLFEGELKKVSDLKELYLHGYSAKALNPNIFKLSGLETLVVSNGALSYVQNDVTKLQKLRELDITETPLATDTEQLERLRKLLPRVKITTYVLPPH